MTALRDPIDIIVLSAFLLVRESLVQSIGIIEGLTDVTLGSHRYRKMGLDRFSHFGRLARALPGLGLGCLLLRLLVSVLRLLLGNMLHASAPVALQHVPSFSSMAPWYC